MDNRGNWGAALAFLIIAGLALWSLTRPPPRPPAPPAPAPAAPPIHIGPPTEVLAHLSRGVNLSNWLQQGAPTEPARYAPDDADFARIAALGLRHVRILVDPAALLNDRGLLRNEQLAVLRAAIDAAGAHDLLVVLALQLPDALKPQVGADPAQREALAGTWRALARALRDVSPKALVLEPLNEDGVESPQASQELTSFLAREIRRVLPEHTLAVAGHRYSGIEELTAMQTLDDANVVYSFHFYEPYEFTHQGATWGKPLWKVLRGFPYPSSPERVAPLLPKAGPQARKALAWHGQQHWDRDKLAAQIKRAADWAHQHNVKVWCSEFGVLKLRAAPADRAAWLRDVHELLEEQHVAWSVWDYAGPFGIVSGTRGHRVPDPGAVKALGLKTS